jgi:16S rRNA (guanine966-N2)-methyltransferase
MSKPRIISGEAKGQHLKSVPGNITRPITDKVKEALFNILGTNIVESYFLDLFGGTGSVGLEALSRGAEYVLFIDIHHAAYKTIKTNLENLKFEQFADVLNQDAIKYLDNLPSRAFDYIFVAPPQYKDIWKKTLSKLDTHIGWLHPDGLVIVQIDILEYENIPLNHLEETNQRRYGDTLLVFYRLKSSVPSSDL